jgi:hypothetical protein
MIETNQSTGGDNLNIVISLLVGMPNGTITLENSAAFSYKVKYIITL